MIDQFTFLSVFLVVVKATGLILTAMVAGGILGVAGVFVMMLAKTLWRAATGK